MPHHSTIAILALAGLFLSLWTLPATAQAPCDEEPGFQTMDFWVGTWTVVTAQGQQAGTNRIEKILSGCAILEHWTGSGGSQGKSLFYYNPVTDAWKQVWITQNATAQGGLKEKNLIEKRDDGGLRFQGEIPLAGGGSYLDRTTLTPLPDGRVRQVIEWSTDDGATWNTAFDAFYVRDE